MPKFTIERQFLVPHYRHATYNAPDLATALKMAEEDQDWDRQIADYDNSRPEETTGAWEGDDAYHGPDLLRTVTSA